MRRLPPGIHVKAWRMCAPLQEKAKVRAGRKASAEEQGGAAAAAVNPQRVYGRQRTDFCQARGYWVPAAWVKHVRKEAAAAQAPRVAAKAAARSSRGGKGARGRPVSGTAVHCREELRFSLAAPDGRSPVQVSALHGRVCGSKHPLRHARTCHAWPSPSRSVPRSCAWLS